MSEQYDDLSEMGKRFLERIYEMQELQQGRYESVRECLEGFAPNIITKLKELM